MSQYFSELLYGIKLSDETKDSLEAITLDGIELKFNEFRKSTGLEVESNIREFNGDINGLIIGVRYDYESLGDDAEPIREINMSKMLELKVQFERVFTSELKKEIVEMVYEWIQETYDDMEDIVIEFTEPNFYMSANYYE